MWKWNEKWERVQIYLDFQSLVLEETCRKMKTKTTTTTTAAVAAAAVAAKNHRISLTCDLVHSIHSAYNGIPGTCTNLRILRMSASTFRSLFTFFLSSSPWKIAFVFLISCGLLPISTGDALICLLVPVLRKICACGFSCSAAVSAMPSTSPCSIYFFIAVIFCFVCGFEGFTVHRIY